MFIKTCIYILLFIPISYAQLFQDTVKVEFTEWMDTTGFQNPNNFIWTNGLVTLDVELADTAVALLTVSEPIINVWYTVEVFNVYDLALNLINPEKDTTGRTWEILPATISKFRSRVHLSGFIP